MKEERQNRKKSLCYECLLMPINIDTRSHEEGSHSFSRKVVTSLFLTVGDFVAKQPLRSLTVIFKFLTILKPTVIITIYFNLLFLFFFLIYIYKLKRKIKNLKLFHGSPLVRYPLGAWERI